MNRTGSGRLGEPSGLRGISAFALPGGLALTAATGAASRRMLTGISDPGADPATAMAGGAAGVASLIAGWLTLCLLLCLIAQFPGAAGGLARRVRDRITPALVRRWAAVALSASVTATVLPGTAVAAVREAGAAVPSPGWRPSPTAPARPAPGNPVLGNAAPENAAPTSTAPTFPSPGWSPADPATSPPAGTATRTAPTPGWTPRRPPARQQGEPHLLTGRQRTVDADASVVVRRGDSLWSIAATRLGPDATDGEIAHDWPRWYAANADDIGDDPHTLQPGMRLTPPTDRS